MKMNHLGKALVLLNLAISIVLLAWAAMLFLQPVDWGWKEARKVWKEHSEGTKAANERIAAKIDERIAAYAKLADNRFRALAGVNQAQKSLQEMETGFGENRRFYNKELARLLASKDAAIDVKEVKVGKDGQVELVKAQPWGLPTFTAALPGITQSYAGYLGDLEKNLAVMKVYGDKITDWVAKKEKLTVKMNGIFKADGTKQVPGEYDLIEGEVVAQRKLKDELAYLQPIWVRELYNAQLLRARREGLEKRLIELGESPSDALRQ